MDTPVNVAVIKGDRRRGAVAQALALLAPELARAVPDRVVVKPNLVSHRVQLPSTHVDTLSATLDTLVASGAKSIIVAEGASDARAGFERFGYRKECVGRPVSFFDINRDESAWETFDLLGTDGLLRPARLSRTIAEAPFRVSLALAKTHVTSILTLSLKNMLSSIHPDDRVLMHGAKGKGNGYSGWKKWVVEFLKRDDLLVNLLTRCQGRLRNLLSAVSGRNSDAAFERLSDKEKGYLKTVAVMNRNLVTLSGRTKPHLSVIDGFVAMHREGPRHGTPIPLGTIIAGTDAVAVDAVAAAVMGFDPYRVGYIAYAEAAGLGTADLSKIRILGDPIASVRKRCVPHSNDFLQRHWSRLSSSPVPAPHFVKESAGVKV